jgi:hypothetical protein
VCSRMYFRLICNDLVRGYLYIYIHTYSPKAAGGLGCAISPPRKFCTLEALRAVLVCSRMYFRLICNDLVRGYLNIYIYIYIYIHLVRKQLGFGGRYKPPWKILYFGSFQSSSGVFQNVFPECISDLFAMISFVDIYLYIFIHIVPKQLGVWGAL